MFNFNMGLWGGVFAVPNSIADRYIKIAAGDSLKVLLYCLRHAGQELSAGEISRATGVPPDSVTTSIEFWDGMMSADELHANAAAPVTAAATVNFTKTAAPAAISGTALLERDYEFKPSEIADMIKDNKDVAYLYNRCEELYGRPLKPNESKALAVIVGDVGMSPGVALMLMEFCFSLDKTTTTYIKKVAKNWIEQGVDTVALAEEKIKSLKEYYSAEGELKRLLDVKAIPDDRMPLFEKWLYKYKFSVDTIYEAYQQTLDKTGKLRYVYMDKILTELHENGGKTKPAPKSKSANQPDSQATQDSFDLEILQKQIMEKTRKRIKN